jgi:hypothetical protein
MFADPVFVDVVLPLGLISGRISLVCGQAAS